MWRRILEVPLFVLLFGMFFRAWILEGLIVPVRIAGSSMAEAFHGPHRDLACSNCGFPFACDATAPRTLATVSCPNCEYRDADPDAGVLHRGDRLLIDKTAFQLRQPSRWEAVLFLCPTPSSGYCIKRVVGLPGEQVEIRDGDVFVDGRRAKKSLADLRRMAIPVFDARHVASDQKMPRGWGPDRLSSGWQPGDRGFRYTTPLVTAQCDSTGSTSQMSEVQWLWYRHDGPIVDDYGYNQTVSRSLNEVNDLYLLADVAVGGPGSLSLRMDSNGGEFIVRIEAMSGKGRVLHGGQPVVSFQLAATVLDSCVVEAAIADGQFLFAVNEDTLVTYDYGQLETAKGSSLNNRRSRGGNAMPLAIGAASLDVHVSNLRLLRDVYYIDAFPGGVGPATVAKLADDDYFVLGDNSPISIDSRQGGPESVVKGANIVGKPIRWR